MRQVPYPHPGEILNEEFLRPLGLSRVLPASTKQFTVRSKPRQTHLARLRQPVDQQEVRLDVAFAIAGPVAHQRVIAVARGQKPICRKYSQYRYQKPVDILAVSRRRLDAPEIAFECRCVFNRPHSNQP